MFEQVINVDRMEQAVSLFGSFDENIKLLEKTFNVKIHSRGSDIKVTGEAEDVANAIAFLKDGAEMNTAAAETSFADQYGHGLGRLLRSTTLSATPEMQRLFGNTLFTSDTGTLKPLYNPFANGHFLFLK